MSSLSWFAGVLLAFGARVAMAEESEMCQSYGMDFQHEGSYFQNVLSNDNFTFVSQFDNCAPDIAYNILIDPNGTQTLCSDTNLTPDDMDMLSTCPIKKSELFSGPWSILIISNNGHEDPSIAYERDFDLSVGPQLTSTYTPTLTAIVVSTPVVTSTSTVTDVQTTVLDPKTVTSPSTTVTPTRTITPRRVTTTSTKALFTLKFTSYTVQVSQTTKTKTASCRFPRRAATPDPKARIVPTVGPLAQHAKFRRADIEEATERFIEERRIRIVDRAPDPQPLIVTDTNTDNWPEVTETSTAPATTATVINTELSTFTSTPPAITVLKGKATAAVVTVTAPTPTRTVTRYNIATSVTTKTRNIVYTITKTTTPAAVKSACKSAGGILW